MTVRRFRYPDLEGSFGAATQGQGAPHGQELPHEGLRDVQVARLVQSCRTATSFHPGGPAPGEVLHLCHRAHASTTTRRESNKPPNPQTPVPTYSTNDTTKEMRSHNKFCIPLRCIYCFKVLGSELYVSSAEYWLSGNCGRQVVVGNWQLVG